jgi:hypothetical protein
MGDLGEKSFSSHKRGFFKVRADEGTCGWASSATVT